MAKAPWAGIFSLLFPLIPTLLISLLELRHKAHCPTEMADSFRISERVRIISLKLNESLGATFKSRDLVECGWRSCCLIAFGSEGMEVEKIQFNTLSISKRTGGVGETKGREVNGRQIWLWTVSHDFTFHFRQASRALVQYQSSRLSYQFLSLSFLPSFLDDNGYMSS